MTPELFENIRISAVELVSNGLNAYEKQFGALKTDLSKQKFLDSGLELLRRVVDRVEANDEVSILQLKEVLLAIIFDLDFDIEAVKNLLPFIRDELVNFIKSKPNYNASLTRVLNTYFELFLENLGNLEFFSSSSAVDILQSQSEYQYSEALYSIVPREIDSDSGKIYTVFTKERYWEYFSTKDKDQLYSPLSFNRFASSLGFSQYRISISYDSLVVYEGELYKLRSDISSPTLNYFEPSEWIKYSSKRFDSTKSFKNVFTSNIRAAFGKFTDFGFDINEIISDSEVVEFSGNKSIDENSLSSTFGGNGKQVLDSVQELKGITDAFGSYEGSPVGGIEYVTEFSEFLLAAGFGKNTQKAFDIAGGNSAFGRFNVLYKSAITPNRIPGLKFLDAFGSLRSFIHSQSLPKGTPSSSGRVVYNPIYSQFNQGVEDRFTSLDESTSYREPAKIDLLLYSLESIYKRSLSVGDTVKAVLNTLDERGRVPGYEGLGSVKVQMDEFQKVFPPTSYFTEATSDSKVTAGLTGSIRYLLDSYSRLSSVLVRPVLPGRSLEFFGPWIELISNRLEEVVSTLKTVGISSSEFLPDISFKAYEASDEKLVDSLRSLGFRDSEVNTLLEVQSFPQLISDFAPLTDSSDMKSFFKAYELAQLIYEFGGQEGIDAYLTFLYSNNPLDSLLNILSLSQENKSNLTYVNLDKYPKLIGLLIGLTYAVNPGELIKFERILGKNNLTLLESISYLYQQGEYTIIRDRNDIELLKPLVEQMIAGVYEKDGLASPSMTYGQTNSVVPIALKQWTEIIGDNLGRVGSAGIIEGLYDRSKGLTPKELFSILNGPTSVTSLSQALDGFSGGNFASFLRYANLAGLGVKLSSYKNSYQTNNFKVDLSYQFYTLPKVVDDIEELIRYISIIKTIFTSELDYNFPTTSAFSSRLDPLVRAQNKVYEIMPQIISAVVSGEPTSALNVTSGDAQIAESPGIGNSRIPNRVPVKNSVTSEQARRILEYVSSTSELEVTRELPTDVISKFIKFSGNNLLANGIVLTEEALATESARSAKRSFSPATKYELGVEIKRPESKPEEVAKIYSLLEGDPNVKSQALGANYISEPSPPGPPVASFDPVKSCRRFGGSDCESLYADSQDRCVKKFNKSLFPESYSEIPGTLSSVVPVDRPLGTFAKYIPKDVIIPTSAFNDPASFMNLLPSDTSVGKKGEPLLMTISLDPIVYEAGGSELSELGNTEFGVVEFVRARLEKNTEFNCASFDSPFYYQTCMNLMKCKRFSPPYNGEYYLDFCPRTLSGGRLK